MDNETKYNGEVALHHEVLKLIPLIVKNFGNFEGRVKTKSGRAAAFDKVVSSFRNDCDAASTARVLVDDQYGYSVWVKIDIHLQDPCGTHVNYFDTGLHVGNIEGDHFEYDFDQTDTESRCKKITTMPLTDIAHVQAEIRQANKRIAELKGSVPAAFREIVSARY